MGIPYLAVPEDDQFDVLLVKYPILITAWALLAFAPRWNLTLPIVLTVVIFYALVYVLILADSMFINPIPMVTPDWTPPSLLAKLCAPGELKCEIKPDKLIDLFSSLDGVHVLFSSKSACFGGWVHYCVFDLLAGVSIVRIHRSGYNKSLYVHGFLFIR